MKNYDLRKYTFFFRKYMFFYLKENICSQLKVRYYTSEYVISIHRKNIFHFLDIFSFGVSVNCSKNSSNDENIEILSGEPQKVSKSQQEGHDFSRRWFNFNRISLFPFSSFFSFFLFSFFVQFFFLQKFTSRRNFQDI